VATNAAEAAERSAAEAAERSAAEAAERGTAEVATSAAEAAISAITAQPHIAGAM